MSNEQTAGSLTWNNRPPLTTVLASFALQSGDQFTQLEVTNILAADPTALQNFALTETSNLERTKFDNKLYREPRLITYCQQN